MVSGQFAVTPNPESATYNLTNKMGELLKLDARQTSRHARGLSQYRS
jgi:hypothetical protein